MFRITKYACAVLAQGFAGARTKYIFYMKKASLDKVINVDDIHDIFLYMKYICLM